MSKPRTRAKASNVRSIGRTKCPCGWPVPKNISTKGLYPFGEDACVTFECPQCGIEMSTMGAPVRVRTEVAK